MRYTIVYFITLISENEQRFYSGDPEYALYDHTSYLLPVRLLPKGLRSSYFYGFNRQN